MAKTALRWLPLILALVVFGGTVAYAQTTNVINACVENKTGIMHYIPVPAPFKECPKGELPLQWNIQGPQGPPGVSGYSVITFEGVWPAGIQGTPVAYCPAGKKVLGGGYSTTNPAIILASHPDKVDTSDVWAVEIRNTTDIPWSFMIYAICATVN